jgi:hypothetical protein
MLQHSLVRAGTRANHNDPVLGGLYTTSMIHVGRHGSRSSIWNRLLGITRWDRR